MNTKKYMLGIDQSTTATKALIFDKQANCLCRSDVAHKQYYPKPGWVEHDPDEIFGNVITAIKNVIEKSKISPSEILAISITNQRETVMLWDEEGRPLMNAVVWQCSRSKEIINSPKVQKYSDYILNTTGLCPSPYFSAGKATWIMQNIKTSKNVFFGNMDSWLIWKLTGRHYTDYTNASRTQLFDINKLNWDAKLLELFGLSNVKMPQVKYSDEIFGYTTALGIFDEEIPIAGVIGDSHGALFAQQCWQKGMAKCTFGTGGSIMLNIGEKPVFSKNNINTSIAFGVSKNVEYVFEGTIISMGDTIKWLRDEMEFIKDSEQSEEYANSVKSTQGVYLVPAFMGLGTPYNMSNSRGIICGMHRYTNKRHVVRAGLEAIGYLLKDIIEPMQKDANIDISELRVDGGPTNNSFLMQFVSDILQKNITSNCVEELSALGAVYTGGLAIKYWADKEEIRQLNRIKHTYSSKITKKECDELYLGWEKAVNMII